MRTRLQCSPTRTTRWPSGHTTAPNVCCCRSNTTTTSNNPRSESCPWRSFGNDCKTAAVRQVNSVNLSTSTCPASFPNCATEGSYATIWPLAERLQPGHPRAITPVLRVVRTGHVRAVGTIQCLNARA